ncbi:MAG: hypothetical protein ABJC04_09035, partial [Verrucomicrobiota bacterium]
DGRPTNLTLDQIPADAIVFGNLNDGNSRVSKLKEQQRDYTVLEFLSTKPRLTYLAKVRNPNPEIQDAYQEMPGSLKEYSDKAEKGENPFEEEGAPHREPEPIKKGVH